MISKTKIRCALNKALDEKSPKDANGFRELIHYPMIEFRKKLHEIPSEFPQIIDVHFEFTEEDIKNELTTCVFKTTRRTMKLTYDYKSSMVECFCIGSDIDAVRKIVRLEEIKDFIKEYFPVVKRVVVVKKKAV